VVKKHQLIKTIGIGTAFVVSNAVSTIAQTAPNSNAHLTSELLTQSTAQSGNTEDILKPAQQPIENTEKLNPSANPLSFPTQADEVEVDPQKPITLKQAIELSLKNNQEVQEGKLQVERSEFALREAQAAFFPTLDLGSGLTYGNSAFLDSATEQIIDARTEEVLEENPGVTEEQARELVEDSFTSSSTSSATFEFSSDLTLGYNIYDGGRRGATIKSAQKQLRFSELDLERIVEVARFETARDYYSLQNSDAQVEIERASVEDAQQTLKDAQLLEKAGLGTRFDVLRAEVELAQAQQRLSTAQANQNIARRQLAETLSVSHDTDLSTADKIEKAGEWKFSLPESVVQAFKNRAELEQFLLQREIGAEQSKIALAQVRPTVSANAAYALNNDLEDGDTGFNDNYQVGLNLQWRLFDGGAARALARQSEKDIEIAEVQFANQRNQIRFAVEQAYFGLTSNQKNIVTATKEVELAVESLRLARLRFQAGVGTQTDVIDAQTQLTTARGNLLSSIIDYNQSYVDLQRQVSNTPDNGLQDLP
jgi:outer membrane factor, OMF family